MAAIEQYVPLVLPDVDERAARAALRGQIAHIERALAAAALEACPRLDAGPPLRSLAGPRLLSLGELERVRDDLAGRLTTLQDAAAAQAARQAEARAQLERMLADPPAHKWLRISNEDLGEPGCTHYHVRPRLGPVGLLMSWWRVKISSGCPLAWGRDRRRAPAPPLMGRRSRKRGAAAVPAPAPRAAPPGRAAPVRRRGVRERPKAPWHPVPLVEICVLLGIVLLVMGALDIGSDRGRILVVCGMTLGSLGGLDTALREHLSGFKSHTTVLAAMPGVLAAGVLFFARVPWIAVVAGAALAFLAAFWLWRRAYLSRARS